MNIIFFGAHPDDLEILCGGTIAECVAQGHTVWMATATNGNVGSPTLTNVEIAETRKAEGEAAARALGAKGLIWMNENDEFLFDDERTRLKFINAVRMAEADVIVTHNPNDYHPDHIACSKLASDARIMAAVRLIKTDRPHLAKSPELFHMDSIAGLRFEPQFFVDITQRFEQKQKAVQCHASQNIWLKSIFNTDLGSYVQIQSAFRGLQCGVKYAEAFVQPVYWPRKPISLPFLARA
ncbi:MAG: LmbE family protein [Verrucomicrobia bacterium]|nr:LmbE family protein [Verrucomicrobiota bacterium]